MTSVMDRRHFLLTSLAGAFATPRSAGAQSPGKMPRVGVLATEFPEALGRGLQRPDPGHGDPRPPAAPRHDRQHQGRQLSTAGEERRACSGASPSRPATSRRWEPRHKRRTRTSVNRGHLTCVFRTTAIGLDTRLLIRMSLVRAQPGEPTTAATSETLPDPVRRPARSST
jgi:hypothetical protein